MIGYKCVNVNPKNKKTTDCFVRALTVATRIPYNDVLKELFDIAIRTGYGINSKNVLERFLKAHDYMKIAQPRKDDNTKYLVGEIDQLCPKGQLREGVVIFLASHLTATSDQFGSSPSISDIWDCRHKTIGNYWVKIKE